MRSAAPLAARIKNEALRLGFDRAGIAPAETPLHVEAYRSWIESGAAGEMEYLRRNAELRADPAALFPGALSAVMVLMSYAQPRAPAREPAAPRGASQGGTPAEVRDATAGPAHGVFARYARGRDYHDLMRERLRLLLAFIERHAPGPVCGRLFVDTAPVLERDLAARAGLGWIGKNTNLLDARLGSYVFIGGILLDLALDPDLPEPDRCGRCTRCLDSCPTAAFSAPYVLDARRCLSYHTIELRGPIPLEHREALGSLVFGCDICQEVCPYNRRAPSTPEPDLLPADAERAFADLVGILSLDESAFRRRFAGTAVRRAGRRGLLRNAAVALGNSGRGAAVSALARSLASDPEPLVRSHAAWALGRLGGSEAAAALQQAAGRESDAGVLAGIGAALSACRDATRRGGRRGR